MLTLYSSKSARVRIWLTFCSSKPRDGKFSAGVTPLGNLASLPRGGRFRHNDINPRLFPPFTPLAPHRDGNSRSSGNRNANTGAKGAAWVSFFFYVRFFPRRQYGASRDAPARAFAFRARTTVRRRIGHCATPFTPSLSLSQTNDALLDNWLHAEMRRNENAGVTASRRRIFAARRLPTFAFIIYRLDYCYRSTRLRAKWDFDRHHGKMRRDPPRHAGFYERAAGGRGGFLCTRVRVRARAKLNWN